jgi:hypothetical protein
VFNYLQKDDGNEQSLAHYHYADLSLYGWSGNRSTSTDAIYWPIAPALGDK